MSSIPAKFRFTGDSCPVCRHRNLPSYLVSLVRGFVKLGYSCHECGNPWQTLWATTTARQTAVWYRRRERGCYRCRDGFVE
jgi:transposase-like protein